jgi:hypothetical protein
MYGFCGYKMKQYIEIKKIRFSKEIIHYLEVLNKIYNINSSQFIRQTIIEKLQKDLPEIRKKYKEKTTFVIPF